MADAILAVGVADLGTVIPIEVWRAFFFTLVSHHADRTSETDTCLGVTFLTCAVLVAQFGTVWAIQSSGAFLHAVWGLEACNTPIPTHTICGAAIVQTSFAVVTTNSFTA